MQVAAVAGAGIFAAPNLHQQPSGRRHSVLVQHSSLVPRQISLCPLCLTCILVAPEGPSWGPGPAVLQQGIRPQSLYYRDCSNLWLLPMFPLTVFFSATA